MFVRTSSIGRVFQLDSVISLEVTEPVTGLWVIQTKLSDGSTTNTGPYESQAAAQEAFEFLIDAAGWIKPPGSQS